jgi:hypothetical protein
LYASVTVVFPTGFTVVSVVDSKAVVSVTSVDSSVVVSSLVTVPSEVVVSSAVVSDSAVVEVSSVVVSDALEIEGIPSLKSHAAKESKVHDANTIVISFFFICFTTSS